MRIEARQAGLGAPARAGCARPHVLFVHDHGPGQFGGLARYLARSGWRVTFAATGPVRIAGCDTLVYGTHREPSAATHPYAQSFDRAAINAQGFARAALAASRGGLAPEIVVSHAGPGAGLLARDIFPRARSVAYAEWWYNHPAPDLPERAPGPGEPSSAEQAMIDRMRNAAMALEIASSTAAICPTHFQAQQFPDPLRRALTVHHDGIDVEEFHPGPANVGDPDRPAGLDHLPSDAPLVTYATRGMEPHRGFPQFMAALPALQAALPDAVVAIAGENLVAYGSDAMRRVDWLSEGLRTAGLDRSRVILLGRLSKRSYRWLLRRSDAHIYLTVPFVLSWSVLEAMSSACPLVLSDTAPVREFATTAEALLINMNDPQAIGEAVIETLRDPIATSARRQAARQVVLDRVPASVIHSEKSSLLLHL